MARSLFNLSDINDTNGITINSGVPVEISISSTEGTDVDINGDGVEDLLLIGTSSNNIAENSDRSNYVVFGNNELPASIELTEVDGNNGVEIVNQQLSFSVNVSDLNGDGFDDLAQKTSELVEGQLESDIRVIWGNNELPADIDVFSLNGSNGFNILSDEFGFTFGDFRTDVNGDGIEDLVLRADSGVRENSTAVVFGNNEGFDANFNLDELDGSNGFVVAGGLFFDEINATGQDVNGDGFDDLFFQATFDESLETQTNYVVFGGSELPANIDLSTLGDNEALEITDRENGTLFLSNLSGSIDDLNGDGISEIVVQKFPSDAQTSEITSVIYGREGLSGSIDLSELDSANGFTINATAESGGGIRIQQVLDFNNDGFQDLLLNDIDLDNLALVYGSREGYPAEFDLGNLEGIDHSIIENVDLIATNGVKKGDFDGNGIEDLIFETDETTSYVVFGRPEISDRLDLTDPDENALQIDDSGLGVRVTGVADINGDGLDDAIFQDLEGGATETDRTRIVFGNSDFSSDENSLDTFVYRFFNRNTGVHFYTSNEVERDTVLELPNYSFEGASYQSADPITGNPAPSPVYRFLNQDTGVHLYTISEVERDATQQLDNFSFEGEAFFAYSTEVDGSIPIYRFFNTTSGAHFYTPSAAERDNVEANLPEFQSEGVAYYALPIDE